MKASSVIATRDRILPGVFAQVVIWQVPKPVRGSDHDYKYSLALVADDVCVLRYDNEAGKGDHKHVGNVQERYEFRGIEKLLDDFHVDVGRWIAENRRR